MSEVRNVWSTSPACGLPGEHTVPAYDVLDLRRRTGEERPARDVGPVRLRVVAQDRRRVALGIDGDRDERDLCSRVLAQTLVEPDELGREQRTRVSARRVDEGDGDDFATQIGEGESPAVGGRQRERRGRPDCGQARVTPWLVREHWHHRREHEGDGESRDRPRHEARQPFSSFFSSFRNRQSVPWAMIFWGLALIMPASRRRSA